MAVPEDIQKLAVTDEFGVIVNLHSFRMISNIAVGRFGHLTTGISDTRSQDSINDPELGLKSPESPQTE